MKFGAPEFLKWLWILLPLAIVLIMMHRRRAVNLAALISSKVWKTVIPGYHPKRSHRKTTLRVLALLCIGLALTRPQWDFKWEEVNQRGLDIIVVLDTSKSMLAADIKPNRLQQAQWAVRDFVRQLKGDRIGLIAFAGSSFLQCPVTVDYAAFTMTLNDLYAGIIPRGGTAIAQALKTAKESFSQESEADRVIILITDGEDHEGSPLKMAGELNAENIRLYSIGVGTAEGELIPSANGYLKNEQGQIVKSTLNETLLEKLASKTGGFYVRSAPGDFGLDRIYRRGIAGLQRDEQETRLAKVYEERFAWFAGAALLFLLSEGLLRAPKILIFLLLFCIPRADAADWEKAYRTGDYTNAFHRLEKLTAEFPDVGNYNRGCALYRQNDFQSAEKSFAEAAAQTEDEQLKQKSLYNRGTALLAGTTKKKGAEQIDEALADCETAISLFEQTSSLWKAKQNLERALALKEKLEQQKKEQEQQKQEQQQKEQDENDSKDEKDKEQKQEEKEEKKQEQSPDKSDESDPSGQQEQQTQEPQPSQEQQAQPQQAGEMSEEEAQQLLDAMKQNEKDQREKLHPVLGPPVRVRKDW